MDGAPKKPIKHMPPKMAVQKLKKRQFFFWMGNLIIWIKDQRKLSVSVYEHKNFCFLKERISRIRTVRVRISDISIDSYT